MRVIAGSAKGRKLVAPANIRPTADRVKEALFSILGDVGGERVLDLYAGSGALGIEALSRGAASAVFVDEDVESVRAIERNLNRLDFAARAKILKTPVTRGIEIIARDGSQFGLIFVDPPYKINITKIAEVLDSLYWENVITRDGTVILERPAKSKPIALRSTFVRSLEKTYGDIGLVFYKRGDNNGKSNLSG